MVKLFGQNMVLQVLLILAVLVLLWLRPLLAAIPMDGGETPAVLYGLLTGWLAATPRLAVVLAMVLVLAEGVVLNLLLANVGLVSQNSLLPTFLYVLATGAGATTLTPALLVNGALIAALSQLSLRGSLLTIPPEKACGTTALIGVASLFYQPAVFFLLSYLLIAASFRLYDWKDWMVLLLGFAAPYLPVLATLYFVDGTEEWWLGTVESLSALSLQSGTAATPSVLGAVMMAAIVLWGLAYALAHVGERPVVWQRNATTVLLLLVGGVAASLYQPLLPLRPGYVAIPIVFCLYLLLMGSVDNLSGYVRRRQKAWIYDIALAVVTIAAFLC